MRTALRWFGLFLLLVIATVLTSFMAMIVVGEDRLLDLKAGNQWLVRDLAQQFSREVGRSQQLLSRTGTMLVGAGGAEASGASTFSPEVRREFDLDSGMKGLYLYDPSSDEPLSRLEKPGTVMSADARSLLKSAVGQAVQGTQSLRSIGAGLTAMAVRMGELPRVLVLVFDGSTMLKADGGPNGEKWLILSDDRSALFEGQGEGTRAFPSTTEVAEISKAENPAGERAEWSREWQAANGSVYQIDAMQTGFSGVSAVSLVPIDQSSRYLPFLMQMSLGASFLLTAAVFLLRQIRTLVGSRSKAASTVPDVPPFDSGSI